MQKIRLIIKGLTYSDRQTGAYALLLQEEGGQRKIPIVIGGFEAQSIAMALDKVMNPPRPLTHDLFKNFADTFNISLQEVVIHQIKDGVFFANMLCNGPSGHVVLDARPSDAISLAIRFGCPIFATEDVVEATGLVFEEENPEEPKPEKKKKPPSITIRHEKSSLKEKTMDELNRLLDDAVKREDYEEAARIRDEMEKRES